jgi:hypothetical protein
MSAERDDRRDAIDVLIDETARSLTGAAPGVSLRARVRSAIDTAPRHRPWAWQPTLAGAAVVVIAALAIWQWPFGSGGGVRPTTTQRAERAPEPPLVEPPPPDTSGGDSSNSVETVARTAAVLGSTPAVLVRDAATVAAELLPAIEPIAIEPVEPSAMAVIERMPAPMPVEIERLAIEQLFE